MIRRTDRGFAIYEENIPCHPQGRITVAESSLACEGAHVWVRGDGCFPYPDLGEPTMQLDVPSAVRLIAALQEFVRSAETDQLTEPAGIPGACSRCQP